MKIFSEEYFMNEAIKEAHKAAEEGEVPVGAIIVCKNQIIARAYNQTEKLCDVTAHAEIIALTSASNYLGNKYLNDCHLYVTLEPCVMCAGALAWAQLGKLVFGAFDHKKGFTTHTQPILHPKTKIVEGIQPEVCKSLLQNFFKERR